MPYSKVDSGLEFDHTQWVVSLINTKTGSGGLVGGHAKIIVEGVVRNSASSAHFRDELFVGEYHIMEANQQIQESWIPQALRNTKSNYSVLFSERNTYVAGKEQQYRESSSKSWIVKPAAVKAMIANVKDEERQIAAGEKLGQFQYAGQWCIYSYKGGHNCTTWAEEQLEIAGVGSGAKITDLVKASPAKHVKTCVIL